MRLSFLKLDTELHKPKIDEVAADDDVHVMLPLFLLFGVLSEKQLMNWYKENRHIYKCKYMGVSYSTITFNRGLFIHFKMMRRVMNTVRLNY